MQQEKEQRRLEALERAQKEAQFTAIKKKRRKVIADDDEEGEEEEEQQSQDGGMKQQEGIVTLPSVRTPPVDVLTRWWPGVPGARVSPAGA